MTSPHKLVSPQGVLHLVPGDKKFKAAFCRAHDLRVDYMNSHIKGDPKYRSHGGWQLLDMVQVLQHSDGAHVAVVGKAKEFFDARGDACERAGLDRSAMPFSLRQLQRLLDADDSSV